MNNLGRILVTGASGFIGSHLVEALRARGEDVVPFVHYGRNGWLNDGIGGDVRDYHSVLSAMRGCDTVFHLAALIGIPYSYQSPASYIDTNVLGTLNVLQAARDCGVSHCIVTSTSEVYGTAQKQYMDETHSLNAQSPYAASKIGADALAMSFHKSFDLPVSIIRPFNTYGPRQSARAVIATIITQALQGDTIRLGNISAVRDFTYVEDTVAAFITIADNFQPGRVMNVGSGSTVSIQDIVYEVSYIMERPLSITSDDQRARPEASEVDRLCADAFLARALPWTPRVDFEEGLRRTIDWWKSRHISSTEYAI